MNPVEAMELYLFSFPVGPQRGGRPASIINQMFKYTEIFSKEKYVCTIFAVLISLYVNEQLNNFHELMVFTMIVFMNTR